MGAKRDMCTVIFYFNLIVLIMVFSYDMYANAPSNYLMEPDTSAVGLLWSQVPDARVSINHSNITIPSIIITKLFYL